MKLNEVKEFVKELRGLSQEELAKRENELKKELFETSFPSCYWSIGTNSSLERS